MIKLNGINIEQYKIIYKNGSEEAEKSASMLHEYIKKLSPKFDEYKKTATILVTHDDCECGEDKILIELGENGLIIKGDSSRSVHYAVSEFLDKYLGWRFYSSEDEKNVLKGDIDLSPFRYEFKPQFVFRYNHNAGCYGLETSYKQKSNMFMGRRMSKAATQFNSIDNKWGHSYFDYVSPEEFFDTHPEYFAMNEKGERINNGQLCLSNKEVYNIVLKRAIEKIKTQPECEMIAFSQNDNDKYCRCEKCQRAYKRYKTEGATNILFVNRLARAIKKVAPNMGVMTFAYQYSERPPVNLKIENNVYIFQALMNECKEHLLTDWHCRFNPKMINCLSCWSALTDNVFLWVYITDFLNHLLGIPKNIRFIYQNFQIYKHYKVKGIMWQNAGDTVADFSDLWGYLASKLNWNVNLTYVEYYELIVEYFKTHFGKAWEYVLEYVNVKANQPASDACFNPYPTAEMIAPFKKLPCGEYDYSYINMATSLLDKAEAVAETEEYKINVQKCRICLDWYILEVTHKTYTQENIAEFAKKAKDLYYRIKKLNDTPLGEGKRLAREDEINFEETPQNWLKWNV